MRAGYPIHWDAVERWSPTLFLLGGGLVATHATVQGIEALTAISTPPDVFVTTGHLIALVGLLGLYPVLIDRMPKLARTAGSLAMISVAGWLAMTAAKFLAIAGIVSSMTDALPGVLLLVVLVSTMLAYVLFGAGTLRVSGNSRPVGLLVLAPAPLFGVLLVASAMVETLPVLGVIIGYGFALSMLALGARLRTWNRPSEHTVPATDATAG